MTPDERALLQRFLQDLAQTRGVTKDQEAENMIMDTLRASRDAPYVLVQHAIMSDQALHAAQDQIAQLQQQLRSVPAPMTPPASSFGTGPSPWAQAAPQQPQWQTPPQPQPAPQWQAPPQPQAQPYVGPGPFAAGGGLGSFMRSAGTTAAGVAGGALLFEGISGLFHGHGGGFGGGFGGGGGTTEIIENNYYDDNSGGGGNFGGDSFGGDSGGGWDDGDSNDI